MRCYCHISDLKPINILINNNLTHSQQTYTCSKSTIKNTKKGVKFAEVNNNDVVLVSLLLTLNKFHVFSSVSIVNFAHVFVRMHWKIPWKPLIHCLKKSCKSPRPRPMPCHRSFYTPWEHQKNPGFLTFSVSIERHQRYETG